MHAKTLDKEIEFMQATAGIKEVEKQIETGSAFLIRCGLKKVNEMPRMGNVPE